MKGHPSDVPQKQPQSNPPADSKRLGEASAVAAGLRGAVLRWAVLSSCLLKINRTSCGILHEQKMTLQGLTTTDIAALIGVVFGTAGFVLGIMNFLRDRPVVSVVLNWDMSIANDPQYDANKRWGTIRGVNVGRRLVFVSHVSLKLPRGHRYTHLLVTRGIIGTKLEEGGAPVSWVVSQDNMEQYAEDWRKIRAVVYDSAGKKYRSKKLPKSDKPSWAK